MVTDTYCRLCAIQYPIHRVKDLTKIRSDKLDEMMARLCNVQISDSDFAKCVCMPCCFTVTNFHKFLEQVIKAQVTLQQCQAELKYHRATTKLEDSVDSYASIVESAVKNDTTGDPDFVGSDNLEQDITISENNVKQYRVSEKRLDIILSKYIWKCTKCDTNFTFDTEENLKLHYKQDHSEIPLEYSCIDCTACFADLKQFRQHVLEHEEKLRTLTKTRKIMCNICGKVFPGKKNYLLHRFIHIGIKRFSCDDCGKSFMQRPHLKSHMALVHSEATPFDCPQCDKKFKTKNSLQVHLQSHLPMESRYKATCDLCGKKFLTATGLRYHKLIHTGTHEYTCEHCGKSFTLKGNLQEHVLTHSNVTPYHCEQCPKAFKNIYRLRQHQSFHSDVKPYECEVCNAKFKKRTVLSQHLTIHTGERPFECSFCKRKFRLRKSLNIHLRQHTGEKPYHCRECNHHFTSSGNYFKHMKCRHSVKTDSVLTTDVS